MPCGAPQGEGRQREKKGVGGASPQPRLAGLVGLCLVADWAFGLPGGATTASVHVVLCPGAQGCGDSTSLLGCSGEIMLLQAKDEKRVLHSFRGCYCKANYLGLNVGGM